jgi:hypothetical protein
VLEGELKPPQNCPATRSATILVGIVGGTYVDFILINEPSTSLHEHHQHVISLDRRGNTHGVIQRIMSESRRGSEQGNDEGLGEHFLYCIE